jgi:hypothetical protein
MSLPKFKVEVKKNEIDSITIIEETDKQSHSNWKCKYATKANITKRDINIKRQGGDSNGLLHSLRM